MKRRGLSAAIITKNEEANIERCLRSLTFVDEIVVVDSGSTDRTLEICERYGCRITRTGWMGYGKNKQLAVDSVIHDWVLSVDADEEVTPDLAREIETLLSGDSVLSGYKVRWLSCYLGKWIRHSGWNRKFKLKLFDRTRGGFTDDYLHETVKIEGEVGRLRGVLRHYTYPDLDTVTSKAYLTSEMAAGDMFAAGRRSSILNAYLHGTWTYLKTFLFNLGFLDGWVGHVLATNTAYAVFLKYLRLWEKGRKGGDRRG
jgi:glycosyltransferase involved in cell wall biosynthesis